MIEILHGSPVADPYRWLEDRTSAATEEWLLDQRGLHDTYFSQALGLDYLRARVSTYLNVELIDQPVKTAGKLFYRRRRKDQEQASICVRDSAHGRERVLVDPGKHGPLTSARIYRISSDGSLLAYELKVGGGDTREIHIVDTASEVVFPDYLPLGYARGFAFVPDHSGFLYCHETALLGTSHTIRLHRFGQSGADAVLFHKARTDNSRLILTADTVHLGAVMTCVEEDGPHVDFWLAQYEKCQQWTKVFSDKRGMHAPFLHRGRIFVVTEEGAPNRELIELKENGVRARVVIPERDAAIQELAVLRDRFYPLYCSEGESIICGWTLDGIYTEQVPLPAGGTIHVLPNFGTETDCLFYTSESFAKPVTLHKYIPHVAPFSVNAEERNTVPPASFRVTNVWFQSSDGTRIPMTLVMRRDLNQSQVRPVILTGYGGFGISMRPKFSVLVMIMLELGVVFALPNIRGGSEFGRAWHEAARGRRKQTAFSDFIAAAKWLIRQRLTSPDRLAIFGGSNSGLMVAAAMTQRPDLFRTVLCIAPLLDMVRYERFDNAYKWRPEYGTVADPQDFAALHAYSPYHRIREDVNYPSVLFVTGDHDDRCNPAHVRKAAARLQRRSAQTNPILVDYSPARGHSPVLPLTVRTEALARRIAFLCKELGIKIPEGKTEWQAS